MKSLAKIPEYKEWLADLKNRLMVVQLKTAVAVNEDLLRFYWQLGSDIVQKQTDAHWGDDFLGQLSRDLMKEFPDMKGFSISNLKSHVLKKSLTSCKSFSRVGRDLFELKLKDKYLHHNT